MNAPDDSRSVRELVGTLVAQSGMLFRQELMLARLEMTAKARSAAADSAMLIVGAAFAQIGLLLLVATIAIALRAVLPLWMAALIVGAGSSVVGAIFAAVGIARLRSLEIAPQQTIASLREVRTLARRSDPKRTTHRGATVP